MTRIEAVDVLRDAMQAATDALARVKEAAERLDLDTLADDVGQVQRAASCAWEGVEDYDDMLTREHGCCMTCYGEPWADDPEEGCADCESTGYARS